MQQSKMLIIIICCTFISYFSITPPSFAADGAVEVSITLSGTILFGLGYRLYIDDDSSVRMGGYFGFQGKPYGFHLGYIQDLSHSQKWPPYAGLGGDLMMARDKGSYKFAYFVRGVAGIAYKPHQNCAWNSELWVAFFPKNRRLAPIGLSFGYLDTLQ